MEQRYFKFLVIIFKGFINIISHANDEILIKQFYFILVVFIMLSEEYFNIYKNILKLLKIRKYTDKEKQSHEGTSTWNGD